MVLEMGLSIHGDTPKWMVYFMENPNLKWMITRGISLSRNLQRFQILTQKDSPVTGLLRIKLQAQALGRTTTRGWGDLKEPAPMASLTRENHRICMDLWWFTLILTVFNQEKVGCDQTNWDIPSPPNSQLDPWQPLKTRQSDLCGSPKQFYLAVLYIYIYINIYGIYG